MSETTAISDASASGGPAETTGPVEAVPAQPAAPPPAAVRSGQLSWLSIAGVVALFIAVGHGWSINTGLYLDDHAHYEHLRDGDWSYRSAVDASRLGIVGEVLDLWGRQEAGLRFYRPIAFWIMRAEYTVAGWRAWPMHLISLGWHFGCAMLMGVVAVRCLGRQFWGMVAACLMAIHPAHVGTVYWVACQTELLTTFFLLAGVLTYARYAQWTTPWFGAAPRPAVAGPANAPGPRPSPAFGLLAVGCYALALGCRENAALFPLVCWLGDRLIGTPRRRWIRWEHLAMGGVFAGYMVLRWEALGGFPVPPPPYLVPVTASLEFVKYLAYKTTIYVLGLFCFIPAVPLGSRYFFAERLGLFYGLFAAAIVVLLIVWWAYRFRPALLWPAVWMACLLAPVMPVFASPHHLYLPSLGMVLPATAALAALAGHTGQAGSSAGRAWGRFRPIAVGCLLFVLAIGLSTVAWATGFAYVRGTLSEDLVVRDVLRQDKPLRDGDHLFFINLPVLAYYAIPAIEQELGYHDLHGHVLVFSPDLIRMEAPSTIEILDRHQLRIRAPEGRPYLAGITGTMLMGVMGMEGLNEGRQIDAGVFEVMVTEMNQTGGVRELLFKFREPLDSPNYHFYLGSPQFMAYELSGPGA